MEVSGQLHNPAALRERAPGTHCIGGCVDHRAGLEAVVKRKIPAPAGNQTPDHPIVQPVAASTNYKSVIIILGVETARHWNPEWYLS